MSKLFNTISKILHTNEDSIDYQRAIRLVDVMNRDATKDAEIFGIISDICHPGDRRVKSHTILLLDFLFKNANPQLIQRLVNQPFVISTQEQFITGDPELHKLLCGLSVEWIKIAEKNGCCTSTFASWQNNICSYSYEYIMTEAIAKKFTAELSGCVELLMMFNMYMQELMNSNAEKTDSILDQILPNIHEIHVRVKELKPTISDAYVKAVLNYIEEYCVACKVAYSDYNQVSTCDIEGLKALAQRGIPKRDNFATQPQGQIPPLAPPPSSKAKTTGR